MSRRWHRSVAGVLLLPLLLTATTGMVYRFCRGVLGVPGEQMSWLLRIHQGSYLPIPHAPVFYTCFLGCSVLAMLYTARSMIVLPRLRNVYPFKSVRRVHNFVASAMFPFVVCTAMTGMTYRFLRAVLLIDKPKVHWLLRVHEFDLFPGSNVVYTLLLGLSVLFIAISGSSMLSWPVDCGGANATPASPRGRARISSDDVDRYGAEADVDDHDTAPLAHSARP